MSHIKCIINIWLKLTKALRHESDPKASRETPLCFPVFISPSQCSQKLGSNERCSIRNTYRIQKWNFGILYLWVALFRLGYLFIIFICGCISPKSVCNQSKSHQHLLWITSICLDFDKVSKWEIFSKFRARMILWHYFITNWFAIQSWPGSL